VGTFHTFSETSRGYLWAWPWVRAVWSKLDARVAVSEAAREFATRYHRADFEIIPNAIALPPSPPPPRMGKGPLQVLFVGRMDEPRKGFGPLLRAVRRVEAETPGTLTLTAIGRGAGHWQSAAAGLPVTFGGELGDADLAQAYARADVVAIPSLGGESFGVVALEAMAHHRPVVASRIAGYAGWMEAAGRLVPPGDDAALAAALRELAASPALRADLSARGAALAREYAWDAIVERWLALYRAGVAT
jgi:phosphatidylinositol alpha-mannosyltransferase